MPEEWSSNKRYQTDYDWAKGQTKHTLKEFEKQIYYSNGEYQNSHTKKFEIRVAKGQLEFKKQVNRESNGPGNYIADSKGYKISSHLAAPNIEEME